MTNPSTNAVTRYDQVALTEHDLYLFNEGSNFRMYRKLGAHPCNRDGVDGTHFAVWAPGAAFVSVVGDFNYWGRDSHPLSPVGGSGIWAGFLPNIHAGEVYKYFIRSNFNGYQVEKADPYGFMQEEPPKTASRVASLDYDWNDHDWMKSRGPKQTLQSPWSIYELHIGSWMRKPNGQPHTYREIAPLLADYARKMNFTHVELLPVMEHPFYGSWGYQSTGLFAPTSRYGTPRDFMFLVDHLHQNGIGVILDWVPSHFPADEHGLVYFDGSHLYEHEDPRKGWHPDWGSAIYNYGRHEVRSFLLSSAMFWLEYFHADAIRVDAVASMLYLDYSRKDGEWIPNFYGGNENLEAKDFLCRFNTEVYKEYPDVQTIAEESTAWAGVSRPVSTGGLGFGMKWDMGWMHDTLKYMSRDAIYRQFHQSELTFRMIYAFTENFVLALSHDEVVHGKGSISSKMAGDDWQKMANLRLLFGYMFGMPGKKLLFMGMEWGQWQEWSHERELQWDQIEFPPHQGIQNWVRDLNALYRNEPAMHRGDCTHEGFEWIDGSDSAAGTLTFLRRAEGAETILVVCHVTPTVRSGYRVGVPHGGMWREILNSDAGIYWGSGVGNSGLVEAEAIPWNGRAFSLNLTLPPLSVTFFKAG